MKQSIEPASWRTGRNTQSEQQNKKRVKKNKDRLRELQNNTKDNNIQTFGQDGCIIRHTVPPHTTKRRATI